MSGHRGPGAPTESGSEAISDAQPQSPVEDVIDRLAIDLELFIRQNGRTLKYDSDVFCHKNLDSRADAARVNDLVDLLTHNENPTESSSTVEAKFLESDPDQNEELYTPQRKIDAHVGVNICGSISIVVMSPG